MIYDRSRAEQKNPLIGNIKKFPASRWILAWIEQPIVFLDGS